MSHDRSTIFSRSRKNLFGVKGASSVFTAASMIAIACASGSAAAQTTAGANDDSGSQMIVVTAQRRQELSRDVPITITTVNSEALQAANVDSLMSLSKLAPGVRIDQQGSFTQPTIRGIGTTLVQTGIGSNVGTYIDGYYLPNSLALDFEFLNVESIQVLKGPQGTLFGRNTTGGAILVTTADPSQETKIIAEASYGRFNEKKIKGYYTTGLSDSVALSLEGQWSDGDGFVTNLYDGSLATGGGFAEGADVKHPGASEKWTVRSALKWDASDRASFVLRYTHTDRNDPKGNLGSTYRVDGIPYSAGDTIPGTLFSFDRRHVVNNARVYFRVKTNTVQLTGNFDLDFADLTSYSQYRKEDIENLSDNDRTSASILGLDLPQQTELLTQELLLSSKPGSRLQYTAGVFLYHEKIAQQVGLSAPFGVFFGAPDANTFFSFSGTGAKVSTYAAYFDGTYELTDNLFLTGGLRYSHDEVNDVYYQTAPGNPDGRTYQSDRKDDKLSPRVVLRYKPTESSSIYASYTKGYKSAVPDYRSTSGGEYLKPEDINAFEVGYKYADNRLTAELAGFWYDYKNLQNGFYRVGETILSNAAKSRIKGVEAALSYELVDGFEISAAGTYIDAKYRDYDSAGFFEPLIGPDVDGDGVPDYTGFSTDNPADASGNRVQRTPKFTGNITARYSTEVSGGRLVASTNLFHSARVYFDASNQFSQGSYNILSARLQWTDPSETYTFAVFGDNLLDEKYVTQFNVGTTNASNVWGKPLTYGVSVRVEL